jgi:predicted RNA-binding Zn ribbon-like protein
VIPQTLIQLANLGLARRPARSTARQIEPVLPDALTATRQLAQLIPRPVTRADLPALRHVHRIAVEAAAALLNTTPIDCSAINALAHESVARVEIVSDHDGTLRQSLAWEDPSISSYVARRLIEELAAADPRRLRRCARAECDLLFYDTTRSRTQRWHAEDPCGWRERQRQQRARIRSTSRST